MMLRLNYYLIGSMVDIVPATKISLERIRYASYQPQGIESMALSCDSTLLAVGMFVNYLMRDRPREQEY